jgi:hypothetical protein
MARFPYYQKNIRKLGEVLARARTDQDFRQKFMANPESVLKEVELPPSVQHLMNFEVIDGSKHKAVVLPYRLNQSKLDSIDSEYVRGLANSFPRVN